jgi:hypothetical protein
MRRMFFCLMFVGLMGLWASSLMATGPANAAEPDTAPAVAVQRVSIPAAGLRDEAAMVLVGTALIGLAAAVRRAA